mmetsp:Transcript_44144/g.88537  ORF Transcript_44144/g.88537 Transcript_44144/m.88537 type:complete len:204 (+) Transcript_44144:551-1162(+)
MSCLRSLAWSILALRILTRHCARLYACSAASSAAHSIGSCWLAAAGYGTGTCCTRGAVGAAAGTFTITWPCWHGSSPHSSSSSSGASSSSSSGSSSSSSCGSSSSSSGSSSSSSPGSSSCSSSCGGVGPPACAIPGPASSSSSSAGSLATGAEGGLGGPGGVGGKGGAPAPAPALAVGAACSSSSSSPFWGKLPEAHTPVVGR